MIKYLVKEFGFTGVDDFINSTIKVKFLAFSISFATISATIENIWGVKYVTAMAFASLVLLELLTGLWASVFVKKQKIESKKFSRFGLKFMVWIVLLFVINSFKKQWVGESIIVYEVFDWIYIIMFNYISIEYIISVLENLGKITGKSYTNLINSLQGKQNIKEKEDELT